VGQGEVGGCRVKFILTWLWKGGPISVLFGINGLYATKVTTLPLKQPISYYSIDAENDMKCCWWERVTACSCHTGDETTWELHNLTVILILGFLVNTG